MSLNIDIAELYESASDDEQRYIQNVALFLTGFLGVHLKVRGIGSGHQGELR